MTRDLVPRGTNSALAVITVTEEQKALVKSVVFPNSTDDELALFIFQCQRKGVHPLDRLIFPIKRNDSESGGQKITFQSGIDYFRSAAEGTSLYDGQDEPEFEFDGTTGNPAYPSLARVKLYKKGISRPFVGIARWSEFYPGEKLGFMYRKMPCNQLAKCAEAQAFRKAFPAQLGDLYTPEEMIQADVTPADVAGTRTTSIKPSGTSAGQSEKQAAAVDAVIVNPLDEEIYEILAYLTKGDFTEMDAMLVKASHYKDSSKKDFSFNMERLPKVTDNWKNKTLPKLRKMKAEAEVLDAELKNGKPNAPAEVGEEPDTGSIEKG
jgi:phage recombination protein Bet